MNYETIKLVPVEYFLTLGSELLTQLWFRETQDHHQYSSEIILVMLSVLL